VSAGSRAAGEVVVRLEVSTPRRGATPASYLTRDKAYRVCFDDICMKSWEALDLAALDAELAAAKAEGRNVDDRAYTVARASTLSSLKQRLTRYLADKASGQVRGAFAYGL
jgi:hypothetical protein